MWLWGTNGSPLDSTVWHSRLLGGCHGTHLLTPGDLGYEISPFVGQPQHIPSVHTHPKMKRRKNHLP